MFEITSNQYIKISRGDTATFTVVIDSGDTLQPVPKKFTGVSLSVIKQSTAIHITLIDKLSWYASDRAPGNYVFTYSGTSWKVNGDNANLLDYGIYIESLTGLHDGDSFTLLYTKGDGNKYLPNGSSVTFYLLNHNLNPDVLPIVKKTFYTDGTIKGEYLDQLNHQVVVRTATNYDNVSSEGNFVITLLPDDTNIVPEGNYMYLLKINYLEGNLLYTSTIGNKKSFYVIDDNYSGRLWNNTTSELKRYVHSKGSSLDLTASDIGAVSYEELQGLSDEQQQTARTNIDAVNPNYVETAIDDITLDEIDQNDIVQIIFSGGNAKQ